MGRSDHWISQHRWCHGGVMWRATEVRYKQQRRAWAVKRQVWKRRETAAWVAPFRRIILCLAMDSNLTLLRLPRLTTLRIRGPRAAYRF